MELSFSWRHSFSDPKPLWLSKAPRLLHSSSNATHWNDKLSIALLGSLRYQIPDSSSNNINNNMFFMSFSICYRSQHRHYYHRPGPAKPPEKLSGRPDTGPPPVPPVPSPPQRCNSEPQPMKQDETGTIHNNTQHPGISLAIQAPNLSKMRCSRMFLIFHVSSWYLYRISTKFFECSTRYGFHCGRTSGASEVWLPYLDVERRRRHVQDLPSLCQRWSRHPREEQWTKDIAI